MLTSFSLRTGRSLTACIIIGSMMAFISAGCNNGPAIAKVEPEPAKPGDTVAIEGTGFGEKMEDAVVKVDGVEMPIKRADSGSLVIELPKGLKAGTHNLTVGNRVTAKESGPVNLRVIEVVTIPAGTKLHVRTGTTISSKENNAGDVFPLTLAQPLVVNGRTIANTGSSVTGRITHAEASGRVKGLAELGFTLIEVEALDGTRELQVVTSNIFTRAQSTKKRDAGVIGGSAAAGAIVGGIFGGKKGALVGAGAGGAAGTGAVLATAGKEVEYRAGTEFTFVLKEPIQFEISPARS